MKTFRPKSTSEQVADYLREQIICGSLADTMPGIKKLIQMLGVNSQAVVAAVKQLEVEGFVVGQGNRRRRQIVIPDGIEPSSLNIKILHYGVDEPKREYMLDIRHELSKAGHTVDFASSSLTEMAMDTQRVARLVRNTKADAWLVVTATREILEWFSDQTVPVFALSGRMNGLPLAGGGPDKISAYREAARRLIALGHRKICMLVNEGSRNPSPGVREQAFLDELSAAGIPVGSYNLPDIHEDEDDVGFRRCLDSLFEHTPPTALFFDHYVCLHAGLQYLAQRGIVAPRDVSMICGCYDLSFAWCHPSIAHIAWDNRPMCRAVLRWANNIARGKTDTRQSFTNAAFVEGGTIGPVPQ